VNSKHGALIAVVALVASFPVGWYFARHSEAFEEADRFVREQIVIREQVGEIRTVTLPLFGAEMNVSGTSGDAKFELKIAGSTHNAMVYAELKKHGTWEVQLARLVPENQPPILLYSVAAQPINSPDAAR
jgi:hypothetical protein